METNEQPQEVENKEEFVPKFSDPTRAFSMSVADDKMSAQLTIDTMNLNLNEFASYHVQDYLAKSQLDTEAIDFSSIGYIFGEVNRIKGNKTGPSQVIKATVAKGKNPEPGENGNLYFDFPINQRVVIKDDGTADYRNIDKYVSIKKGQKVATVYQGMVGKPGKDVLGQPIPAPPIEKPKLIVGKNLTANTREEIDKFRNIRTYTDYFASCDGALYSTDNSIAVSPELIVDSDVGLVSGNIKFDGTVSVKGTIEDGSLVECTGNLMVSENIESAGVSVGGDLTVKGGIKTNLKGVLRVGGSLHSKFIENSILEVDGDIYVEQAILSSKIYCLGSIILTGKSNAIMGSEIYVHNGLSVHSLGSNAGLDVSIELGLHYKNERLFTELAEQIRNSEKELEKLAPKVQQVKLYISKTRGKLDDERKTKFKEVLDMYQKKDNTYKMLLSKFEELKLKRFNLEKINLVVRNAAYPGASIKYRRQVEKIGKQQSAFMMSFFPGQDHAPMTAISTKKKSE
jgi:uncharacterized protein (DUF342 family)